MRIGGSCDDCSLMAAAYAVQQRSDLDRAAAVDGAFTGLASDKADRADISPTAQALLNGEVNLPGDAAPDAAEAPLAASPTGDQANPSNGSQSPHDEQDAFLHALAGSQGQLAGNALTPQELDQVQQLELRDREVRAHEMAHKIVAGGFARGGPFYDFQRGPDGQQYAVGGHVNIDTGEEATPEATLHKAEVVQRAALAPAEPSAADRAIAASAAQMASQARIDMRLEDQEALLQLAVTQITNPLFGEDSDQSNVGDQLEPVVESAIVGDAALQANIIAEFLGYR